MTGGAARSGLRFETCLGGVASQGARRRALLDALEGIAHAAAAARLTRWPACVFLCLAGITWGNPAALCGEYATPGRGVLSAHELLPATSDRRAHRDFTIHSRGNSGDSRSIVARRGERLSEIHRGPSGAQHFLREQRHPRYWHKYRHR
jgi:hypothetical protein